MPSLPSIDHIRRPTLNPRLRAELHQRLARPRRASCTSTTGQRSSGRLRRRAIFEQIQHTHDLLWDLDCFQGRQPARPGEPPLPPTSDEPTYLHGRRLRSTCLAILLAHGRRSLPGAAHA